MKLRAKQLLRYAAVGIATLAVYLAAGQLMENRGLSRIWLLLLPFAAAVTLNYLLQRGWVFRDERPVAVSLPRYLTMIGAGWLVNAAALGLSPFGVLLWTQLYAASLVVVSNAVFSFLWVFATSSSPQPD